MMGEDVSVNFIQADFSTDEFESEYFMEDEDYDTELGKKLWMIQKVN